MASDSISTVSEGERVGGKLQPGCRAQHGRRVTGVVGGGDQQYGLRRRGKLRDPLAEHAFEPRSERHRLRQRDTAVELLRGQCGRKFEQRQRIAARFGGP